MTKMKCLAYEEKVLKISYNFKLSSSESLKSQMKM